MTNVRRVYLAARYSRFRELQGYRDELRAMGFDVRARWVDGEHEMVDGIATEKESRMFAIDDLTDLRGADIVVSFTEEPGAPGRQRGGRHVEFGVALAEGKHLVVVGPRENVFHYLDQVWAFETWEKAKVHLRALVPERVS